MKWKSIEARQLPKANLRNDELILKCCWPRKYLLASKMSLGLIESVFGELFGVNLCFITIVHNFILAGFFYNSSKCDL